MVAPIVLAMEMRDPYTAGHQSRVAEIAIAIGKDMGWTGERLQALRMAAMVHDIGKISIPAELLTKPGNLNAAERAMINQHPETGYAILKDIPFMWPVAEMVHQHHEKLDGSGYPRGLKADEILPEAKVLAVADIVEAMAAYRPYRPGIELPLVLQQIEKDAGTLLDPEVVRTCVALFREKHFTGAGLDTALISHFPHHRQNRKHHRIGDRQTRDDRSGVRPSWIKHGQLPGLGGHYPRSDAIW